MDERLSDVRLYDLDNIPPQPLRWTNGREFVEIPADLSRYDKASLRQWMDEVLR